MGGQRVALENGRGRRVLSVGTYREGPKNVLARRGQSLGVTQMHSFSNGVCLGQIVGDESRGYRTQGRELACVKLFAPGGAWASHHWTLAVPHMYKSLRETDIQLTKLASHMTFPGKYRAPWKNF